MSGVLAGVAKAGVTAAVALGFAGTATAAPARTPALVHASATSSNWSGYVATGTTFSDVKGSWVQPTATCATRGSTYAAFWVGLGGAGNGNGGLEQIGTEADCRSGQPVDTAWYELLPAGAVSIPVTITPGDAISAEVNVSGSTVTLSLTDTTSGATFSTQATPSRLDAGSAVWVAEAPSQCAGAFATRCTPLPLTNFGTAQFSASSATANGHTGTISDTAWSGGAVDLRGSAGSAVTSALSTDGSSFSVAWQSTPAPAPSVSPGGGRGWGGWGWGPPRRHRL